MIYGYARISAKVQLKGNSLEEQKNELRKNGCQIIVEEQFTGKTISRPKFENLIHNQLQPGDTLVVPMKIIQLRVGKNPARSFFYSHNSHLRVHTYSPFSSRINGCTGGKTEWICLLASSSVANILL